MSVMDQASFISTNRGKKKACYKGFYYNLGKRSQTDPKLSFRRCELYQTIRCKRKGRLQIKNTTVVGESDHTHAQNAQKSGVLKAVSKLKGMASSSTASTVALASFGVTRIQPL